MINKNNIKNQINNDNVIEENIINNQVDNENILKENNEPKRWFSSITLFEKLFWLTIIILTIIYILLELIGYINTNNSRSVQKNSIIIEYFPTDIVKQNLSKYEININNNLNFIIKNMDKSINSSIDNIFVEVENNVDKFLDFHYSVKGEYLELFSKITGDLEQELEKKLFGDNFSEKVKVIDDELKNEYAKNIEEHFKIIKEYALEGVDSSLNNNALTLLNDDINKRMNLQEAKIAVTGIAPQVIKLIVAKVTVKVATKVAAKTTVKATASATGATAGTICGPAVFVCAPVAAGIAWFATDVAVVEGDEYLNRENFKKEILSVIEENKELYKNEYKKNYSENIDRLSKEAKQRYSNTPLIDKFK